LSSIISADCDARRADAQDQNDNASHQDLLSNYPESSIEATGHHRSLGESFTISDAYADLAEHPFPRDKNGRTYAQRLAEAQFRAAVKGKTDAAREIANRIEGPAEKPQQVEVVPGSDPLKVRIDAPELIRAIRQIYGLDCSEGTAPQGEATRSVNESME